MSMSEEHQRGSLDILAATPLSTRTIVLGKWCGTFRMVPLLAIGPGLLALALATAREVPPPPPGPGVGPWELSLGYRLFAAALLVATILAHGAATTSVGLALAIWIKRQSRAIAISVGLLVLVAVGWPFLVGLLGGPDRVGPGLSALSPIFGTGFFPVLLAMRRADEFRDLLSWAAFWVVEVTLLAAGILWLTIRTFDRCFGRMPESPRPSSSLPLVLHWAVTIACACAIRAFASWGYDIVSAVSWNHDDATRFFSFTMVVIFELLVWSLVAVGVALVRQHARRGPHPAPIKATYKGAAPPIEK